MHNHSILVCEFFFIRLRPPSPRKKQICIKSMRVCISLYEYEEKSFSSPIIFRASQAEANTHTTWKAQAISAALFRIIIPNMQYLELVTTHQHTHTTQSENNKRKNIFPSESFFPREAESSIKVHTHTFKRKRRYPLVKGWLGFNIYLVLIFITNHA